MRSARVRSWVCVGATLTFSIAGPLVWDGRIPSLYERAHPRALGAIEADRSYAMLELRAHIERLETGDLQLRPRVTVTFRDSGVPNRPEGSGVVDLRLPFPTVIVTR